MAERCPNCERLTGEWAEPSDDDACYARTGYDQDKLDCARLTADALRAKLTKLEARCAAQAKVIEWADELRWQAVGTTIAKEYIKSYDAAKAELEKVR
jgi:hypothetical protein